MKKGTPVPASGLACSAQLFRQDSSYDDGDTSWDSDANQRFAQEQQAAEWLGAEAGFSNQETYSYERQQDQGVTIVRHIASFLTLSDAASMASMDRILHHQEPTPEEEQLNNDWAVGMEWTSHTNSADDRHMSWNSSLATPPTPGIMALSPSEGSFLVKSRDWQANDEEEEAVQRRLQRRHKQWVQQKLTAAIFAHPRSIRSFCLEAHQAAKKITDDRRDRPEHYEQANVNPETFREAPECTTTDNQRRQLRRIAPVQKDKREQLLEFLVNTLLHNVPLSVMFDLAEACIDTGLDTSYAVFRLSVSSVNAVVSGLVHAIQRIWDVITSFNPFAILDAIISMQFTAMGRTSEALASGIQSVATGVGSASNLALQRLSRGGGTGMNNAASSSSLSEKMGLRRSRSYSQNTILNRKLLKKLSTINDAAQVVAYSEREEEGLTRHAKRRVQKMMHYDVNLRPFTATVVDRRKARPKDPFENVDFPSHQEQMSREASIPEIYEEEIVHQVSPQSSSSSMSLDSPFMCTPKSFPPTPASRSLVLARGTRFADDVVFLARDHLRVHDNLDSENERTRAMAKALRAGKRLAVFHAGDVAPGIALSCGQHVATKIGNPLYSSARSMCPVLRNCYVYFEMTVMIPPPAPNAPFQGSAHTTLSVGLSTLEMPLNTLVGAWKSSVGLCSTGQIMAAGQWCSPGDNLSSYGNAATVGCLVRLDDSSPFETWDGVMVTASVTFNVNGVILSSPVSTAPLAAGLLPDPSADKSHSMQETQEPQQPSRGAPSATLQLLVPMEEELFPTLTLHSHATQVMCRFSAEDVAATSRTIIGAPEGATVYAVDGSVLFNGRNSP